MPVGDALGRRCAPRCAQRLFNLSQLLVWRLRLGISVSTDQTGMCSRTGATHADAPYALAGSDAGRRAFDEQTTASGMTVLEAYDEALPPFGHESLTDSWHTELGRIASDDKVTPAIAGQSLRRLHDTRGWLASQRNPGRFWKVMVVALLPEHHFSKCPYQRNGIFLVWQQSKLFAVGGGWRCTPGLICRLKHDKPKPLAAHGI